MFKILEDKKRKDDIAFKEFSDEVNYRFNKFSEDNNKKMKKLSNQRKLNNESKQQLPLWANAIENGKF